jgi:hypothetical protein
MERLAELRCDPTIDPHLISETLRREHGERLGHRHEDSLMFVKKIDAPNRELWVRCTRCDYEERAGEIEARGFEMSEQYKIQSADIEPNGGYHYLISNGQQAARFDSIQKALAAREVTLQWNEMEGPER